jgi:hypothetical protein
LPAFQNHVRFHGGIAARIEYFARADFNNLSHIGPHDAVLQPVIQFRTSIHGKSLTGSVLNGRQKLLTFAQSTLRPALKNLNLSQENGLIVPYGF